MGPTPQGEVRSAVGLGVTRHVHMGTGAYHWDIAPHSQAYPLLGLAAHFALIIHA